MRTTNWWWKSTSIGWNGHEHHRKDPAADGIFCPEESSTLGFLLALRQNQLAGKVKLVGFDTAPSLIEGIKKGEIQFRAQSTKVCCASPLVG